MKRVFNTRLKSGLALTLNSKRLRKLCTDTNISPRDKTLIIQIFEHLFNDSDTIITSRSIRHSGNFDLYFDNALNTKGILFKDFSPLLQKLWPVIETSVRQWISKGKEGYLVDILHDINPFESRDRFEKIMYIWIVLVNHRIRIDYLIEDWIKSISENHETIEKLYEAEKGAKVFFENLFLPNDKPFFYDTYPIRTLLRKYFEEKDGFPFPLSKDELQDISVKRLQDFIASRTEFDVRVFNNFYYNCWKKKDDHDHVILLDDANKLIREYIAKYPEGYLRFTIRSKYTPHLDEEYVFEPFTPQYFGSWDDFKTFLDDLSNRQDEFVEMHQYFSQFKKSRYEGFRSNSIPKWIELDSNGSSSMKYFKSQTQSNFAQEMEELRRKLHVKPI